MGLRENISTESVRQLALREPVLANPTDTVGEVIQRMRQQELGCAIVVDETNKPVGMFNESMLRGLLAAGGWSVQDPVSKHMASKFPWVRLDDPVVHVLSAMETNNTRFLCVVDDDDKVAGLTGQKGLMEYIAEHFPVQVMVQRVGVAPFPSAREGA